MPRLTIRGIKADIGKEHADTFRNVQHPDLRAAYVLANPPFNDSDWFRKDDDVRWQFGVLPKGNANFAWVQHFSCFPEFSRQNQPSTKQSKRMV